METHFQGGEICRLAATAYLDEFPDKILNIMKDKHKENTSLRLLFLKHDSDGSATLDREELSNVLADLQFPSI